LDLDSARQKCRILRLKNQRLREVVFEFLFVLQGFSLFARADVLLYVLSCQIVSERLMKVEQLALECLIFRAYFPFRCFH
jgi:hypothetical protein